MDKDLEKVIYKVFETIALEEDDSAQTLIQNQSRYEYLTRRIAQQIHDYYSKKFNPDYLDFQKGVEAGKEVCEERLRKQAKEIFEELRTKSYFEEHVDILDGNVKNYRYIRIVESDYQDLKRRYE